MSVLIPALSSLLLLFCCYICLSDANRPAAPVNVSVTHLRANSATVSWNVPEGEAVIGYAISQQRQDGLMQRFIREINTTSRACVLWDLDENTDYIIQVQSIGLHGESQTSKRVHFRTLEKSDHFQSNMVAQAVIALFCRQYEIIKDNDSNNHSKEKTKPLSAHSTPDYHNGGLLGNKRTPSAVSIIKV
ncbi:fibronectin type III domain-containing protein 4 isoform X2 [Tachysurus fulvidraco]|uniref:fibronectin type III domain-containing protein 4 isoform X2 n=1 Tax=Tachysurus fulvidraco TaxID=1234273 RepID=UPI000F4DAA6A|nr:fibronectin type III domain-containing protein 4 isoform X2 [Tachysurus fulvidraco]